MRKCREKQSKIKHNTLSKKGFNGDPNLFTFFYIIYMAKCLILPLCSSLIELKKVPNFDRS